MFDKRIWKRSHKELIETEKKERRKQSYFVTSLQKTVNTSSPPLREILPSVLKGLNPP